MAVIKVEWMYIEWGVGYTWAKNVIPQLQEYSLTEEQLERAVYVIRTTGNFAVDYPAKPSPTLYIGEGNFKDRIMQHKNWLRELSDTVGEFPIEIALAIPRARNNWFVYQDMEAELIQTFKRIYGAAPFLNKQMEFPKIEHKYEPYKEFIRPLQMRGKKIPWALKPLPSNSQYENFWKTAE